MTVLQRPPSLRRTPREHGAPTVVVLASPIIWQRLQEVQKLAALLGVEELEIPTVVQKMVGAKRRKWVDHLGSS